MVTLQSILKVENFVGRAVEQMEKFLQTEVEPILTHYADIQPHVPSIQVFKWAPPQRGA